MFRESKSKKEIVNWFIFSVPTTKAFIIFMHNHKDYFLWQFNICHLLNYYSLWLLLLYLYFEYKLYCRISLTFYRQKPVKNMDTFWIILKVSHLKLQRERILCKVETSGCGSWIVLLLLFFGWIKYCEHWKSVFYRNIYKDLK